VEVLNIPRTIAVVVSARLATLNELQTIYGLEDMYSLLEINAVDAHNEHIANKE
jgi:hypothetical protein